MSMLTPMQRSLSANPGIQYEKAPLNNSLNVMKSHKSSNLFGRKKTVSFNNNVSVVNVEKWKCYNIDVSESGGCIAWDAKKNEEKRRQEERKKKQNEDGCICVIF